MPKSEILNSLILFETYAFNWFATVHGKRHLIKIACKLKIALLHTLNSID